MSFLTIPPELHIHITEYLSWEDLYSLIKSHSRLAAMHSPRLLPFAARQDGQAILHWAVKAGNEPMVRLLLEKHHVLLTPSPHDPTVLCHSGRNLAIQLAAQHGHVHIVRLLLENIRGAEPDDQVYLALPGIAILIVMIATLLGLGVVHKTSRGGAAGPPLGAPPS